MTTRQTEGGTGSMPMPGNSPQIKFVLEAFRLRPLVHKSREPLGNAARSQIHAAKGRRPMPIGAGVSLKESGWSLVESIPQAFEAYKTQTAVVLGCSPKTLYNKLNGCARETAFSNS